MKPLKREALFSKLREWGLNSREAYVDEAFSRNIGLLSPEEQKQLAQARVAIAGMGGVGGVHLVTLVRIGVGKFHLADFDAYEPANVNRQFGARVPDFGRPKLEVMVEEALSINPYLDIKAFPEGVNEENIDDFLDGVQVVLDGLDFFNFDTRRRLFNRAQEKNVYVVTAGPMGFSSALLVFSPHDGMTFDEYFNVHDEMAEEDKHLSFGMGLAPRATHIKYMDLSRVNLKKKAGPSLNIACQICSGMAATEAVRIILNRGDVKPVPHFFQFDPYVHRYCKGKLYLGNRNPIQRVKLKVVKMLLARKQAVFVLAQPEVPQIGDILDPVPYQAVRYIIRAGIQAPSGDNAQPWRFSWQNNRLLLYLDREADQSFFNVVQAASIISCGAVLENVQLAATAFGLDARIAYLPDPGNDRLMAAVDLNPAGQAVNPLHEFIWKRCTNRKPYEKRPIPEDILTWLDEQVSHMSGAKLHLVTNRSDLTKLARAVYKADRIRTEHRSLHEHLHEMIRRTREEAQEKRDGLPLRNLEVGLSGEVFLKATRPWYVMSFLNKVGLGRMVPLQAYLSILNSSAMALLTVNGMETGDFLRGGQALQRVWLSLTQKGLAMQPMTAITLFHLRWQLQGSHAFSEAHQRLLTKTFEAYHGLFEDVDFEKEGQVMLFRLGYAKEIEHRTYRKDVDALLMEAGRGEGGRT